MPDTRSSAFRLRRAALVALFSAATVAASPASAQPVAGIFGETVEVRVVNLEVVVVDRDGLPVTGLAAEDFALEVDGKSLPIGFFTEVRGGTAVAPDRSANAASPPAVPELAPGSPVGTSYLVFIDDFFALARDRDRVLRSLAEDLGRLNPEDRLAMVAWDGKALTMLTSWSGSVPEVERALRKATDRPAFGLQRLAEKRSLGNDPRQRNDFGLLGQNRRYSLDPRLDVSERFYAETIQQQTRATIAAAAAALRGFANPPGRKVMVVLAGGWPFDPAEYAVNDFGRTVLEPGLDRGEDLFAPLVDTANQLGYTLYTVDVPGLGTESDIDASEGSPLEFEDRANIFVRENNLHFALQHLARETGGRALINTGRDRALARAASDTRSYYWLGFTPTWQGDDSQHGVEIKVLRDGLRVRSRAGYLDSSRRREVSMAVESVLLFGSGPNVVGLAVDVGKPQKSSAGTMQVPIAISVPLDGLTFLPRDGRFETELELRVAALDERGGRSEIPIVPMKLTVDRLPEAGETGLYQTILALRRAKNQVVAAVYDPASGAIYSSTFEVKP